jgi:membrane-associated phospholipid phosphatase
MDMKKSLLTCAFAWLLVVHVLAQGEPGAGQWKTWFVNSGKEFRLPPPPHDKSEIKEVAAAQRTLDAAGFQGIVYWNAGSPGYRWYSMMGKLWMTDISGNGALANMLLGTAIYDATVAAWDTKYTYNRIRPYVADGKIQVYAPEPESPSYPCEHSVAAGVAATIIAHFFPNLADSATRMAKQVMESRVAAGVAYPSDTRAGFELGKNIAEQEIARTKDFVTKKAWDGKVPQKPGLWKGKNPLMPMAGYSKTAVLDSASQYRPGPPPDFAMEMEELRNFKQTFRSKANAFYYASQPTGENLLNKKIFEYNLHGNPPRAARIYAATAVAYYDAFIACFDAKYAYWGTRPDQYDTTYQSLIPTPPFPGYPSGHAVMSGVVGELFSYFFPAEKQLFMKVAKEGAESRFQGGIHFRTDNDAGLDLGLKVAAKVIERLKADGADQFTNGTTARKAGNKSNVK